MDLLVIRHSIAGQGANDAVRPLTPEGRRRFAREARALAGLGLTVDRAFHSPLLRATETAQLLVEGAGGKAVETPLLAQAPSDSLLDCLGQGKGTVAAVGHYPWVGELTAWLLIGEPAQGSQFFFEPGGVAWLSGEVRPGSMTLRAFFHPEALVLAARP